MPPRLRPRSNPESAEEQQRGLGEASALRQQSELGGRVVEIEEAARPSHAAALELEVVQAVEGEEAVGGGQRAELALLRTDRAPWNAGKGSLADRLPGRLDAEVGEPLAQPIDVVAQCDRSLERLGRERVLVLHVEETAGSERRGSRLGPRLPPRPRQSVDARPGRAGLERMRAHLSSGMPSVGVDASA